MVVNVAIVFTRAGAKIRHQFTGEFADGFTQRRDRVPEHHCLMLEIVQPPDVGIGGALVENPLLDLFQRHFQLVDDRKIAIDHRIHQGVEDETCPLLEQTGLPLATFAYGLKIPCAVTADRKHVVMPGKYVEFANVEFPVLEIQQPQYGKQRVAVFLDFRPLPAVPGILDSQLVQIERRPHALQFLRRRIAQRDPDETVRPLEVSTDVLDGDIRQALAILIGNTINQHGTLRIFSSITD